MADHPIIPPKTAMLFFDTLNAYLHPEDPARQAAVEALGVIPRLQRIDQACRAAGIPIFYAQADHRPDEGRGRGGEVGDRPRGHAVSHTRRTGRTASDREPLAPGLVPRLNGWPCCKATSPQTSQAATSRNARTVSRTSSSVWASET